MMRALVVLVVALLVGLMAAGGARFLFPGPRGVEVAAAPVARVLSDARPLTWLDETTLLVGHEGRIIRYDVARHREAGVVAPAYVPTDHEVITPAGGVFATNEPWLGRDGRLRHDGVVYHRVGDWDRPDAVTALPPVETSRSNRHDGTALEPRDGPDLRSPSGRPLRRSLGTGQLVRAEDGRTLAFLQADETLVVWERAGGADREVRLTFPDPRNSSHEGIASSFDWGADRYLWYERARNFDADRDAWPVRAWWVSRDGEIEGELSLPPGPWVRRYTFWYQLKHFSAGPATYSHMKVMAAGGRVFIHVWGRAVDERVAGLYELDPDAGAWRKRVDGDLDNDVVVSTGGCRLAYARAGELHVMEVCGV